MSSIVFRCLTAAICIAGVAGAASAAVTGTVRGAAAVHVRRGPSPDAQAFAVLNEGNRVTVENVAGAWAAVSLADGERGYVRAAFLDLPAGSAAALEMARSDQGSSTPPPIAATAAPAEGGLGGAVESELGRLRERLAALESALAGAVSAATPAASPTLVPPAGAAGPAVPEDDIGEIGPTLALAGVGFLVGFLLGAAYGQRQERNRRSRVRF